MHVFIKCGNKACTISAWMPDVSLSDSSGCQASVADLETFPLQRAPSEKSMDGAEKDLLSCRRHTSL